MSIIKSNINLGTLPMPARCQSAKKKPPTKATLTGYTFVSIYGIVFEATKTMTYKFVSIYVIVFVRYMSSSLRLHLKFVSIYVIVFEATPIYVIVFEA